MMEFFASMGIERADILGRFVSWIPNILSAAIAAALVFVFYAVTSRVIEEALRRTHMRPSLIKITVHSLYKWSLGIMAIILILSQIGVDVTAALAGVGVVGLAVGFAAQQTLGNIMAGFGIFIDDLYRTGDWVKIAGHYGQVKEITLRTTKIRTLDNVFIILPNAQVTNNPVTNYSEEGMVRITIKIGISYNQPIEEARQVLLAAIRTIEDVREDPEPVVVVDELADSSVNLLARIWVDDAGADQKYRFTLTETCKRALDDAGIPIPFPQRDVHLFEEKM